jgi:hypothetical protein
MDYGTWTHPAGHRVGDVSGDGTPDLVTTGTGLGFSMASVHLGNGDGTLPDEMDYEVGFLPRSIAIGEVSGDGKPDIVTANFFGGSVSVLLGKGGRHIPAERRVRDG